MEIFFGFIVVLLIILIGMEALFLAYYGIISKKLSKQTFLFSRENKLAKTTVMVFGDSTAYGTGAEKPEYSVAGRLASDFPHISLLNFAENGIGAKKLTATLEQHANDKADLVIIHIGGIDIFSLTPSKSFTRSFERAVLLARQIAGDHVIILCSENMGTLPFFHFPLSRFYEWQTRRIHRIIRAITKKQNVAYVDLFEETSKSQSAKNTKLYFAKDKIHPSSEGYALWYKKVKEILTNLGWVTFLNRS